MTLEDSARIRRARPYAYGSRQARPAVAAHAMEHHHPGGAIANTPDQHAFVMLGTKTLFLCHLTMYWMEEHGYQFIVQARLPDAAMQKFRQDRADHPGKTYFLGNSPDDLLTVPDLQSGARRYFIADIFRGIPNKPHYDSWPWEQETPIIPKVRMTIERVVYFRHFAVTFEPPTLLTYVLFGCGDEAHMTNCQTKEPDFDHILSLAETPNWLPPRQLESGVHVSVNVRNDKIHCTNPLPKPDDKVPNTECKVRYRGKGDELLIKIGFHHWFCTKVSNEQNPCAGQAANPCASPP